MGTIADSLFFLGRFLSEPKSVASAWPSSKFLTREMYAGLELESFESVVEFGPGSGAFTSRIAELRSQGHAIRYLGIERDPEFHALLSRRFPELEFALADVMDAHKLVAERGLAPVDAIISGLPLTWMEEADLEHMLTSMREYLSPDGVFRTFNYVHSSPMRGAKILRQRMQEHFRTYEISRPVVRNMPPALVLSGQGPR